MISFPDGSSFSVFILVLQMLQSPEAVLKDLKSRKYAQVYFLHGEESFYIDEITRRIENEALNDQEKSFNQVVLYGKEVSVQDILGQARRFPWMSDRQVVIVREVQQMNDWNKEESNPHLLNYLQSPQPSTLLVLNYKHKIFNKNTNLYKALEKQAVVVESKKPYDNQIANWIQDFVKEKGYQITPAGVQLLSESLGNDLGKLNSEINKLILNLGKETKITEQLIEEFVGISKDYNVFELQKALAQKNRKRIFQILKYWEANPKKQPLIPTLANLYGFFTKILLVASEKDKSNANLTKVIGTNMYAVEDYKTALKNFSPSELKNAIHLIHQSDLQVKGIEASGDTDAEILKELMLKVVFN